MNSKKYSEKNFYNDLKSNYNNEFSSKVDTNYNAKEAKLLKKEISIELDDECVKIILIFYLTLNTTQRKSFLNWIKKIDKKNNLLNKSTTKNISDTIKKHISDSIKHNKKNTEDTLNNTTNTIIDFEIDYKGNLIKYTPNNNISVNVSIVKNNFKKTFSNNDCHSKNYNNKISTKQSKIDYKIVDFIVSKKNYTNYKFKNTLLHKKKHIEHTLNKVPRASNTSINIATKNFFKKYTNSIKKDSTNSSFTTKLPIKILDATIKEVFKGYVKFPLPVISITKIKNSLVLKNIDFLKEFNRTSTQLNIIYEAFIKTEIEYLTATSINEDSLDCTPKYYIFCTPFKGAQIFPLINNDIKINSIEKLSYTLNKYSFATDFSLQEGTAINKFVDNFNKCLITICCDFTLNVFYKDFVKFSQNT